MYLAPEGQELEIARTAGEVLADVLPLDRLQSPASADLGREARVALAGLGWFGLAVPENAGGSGLSAVEHALFFREVGRLCGPVDLLAQCLAASAANDAQVRSALLSGAEGVSLAIAADGGFRLLGAPDARYGVLVSPQGADLLDLAGIAAEPRPGLDPANSLRVCTALPQPFDRREGSHIWRFGQLGVGAMLIGVAEAALDLIVEYAQVRETFGRKIGAWQAVRHPCADMAVRLEAARAQLWFAAAACKEGRTDAQAHLDAAKHLANEAAYKNADSTIQLHGGIGVTEEHAAHLLLKRALLLGRVFGGGRALLGGLLHARLED